MSANAIKWLVFVVLSTALALTTSAQNSAPPITIPDRIVFRAVASNKIDTKRAKLGDKVRMLVVAKETLDNGTVIEAGTRLEGRVVETTAFSPDTHEARLSIRIDRLALKKQWIPMHGFIVAQGQIRTRQTSTYETRKYTVITGSEIVKYSPLLRDVEFYEVGKPTHGSYMVSHKKDIVIEPDMAFLIRNSIPK